MFQYKKGVAFLPRDRRTGLKSILFAGLLVIGALAGATAQSTGVEVQHAWARATPAGAKTAALYMTLVNHGPADDRLLSVTTPAAGKAEVHSTTTENGVTRMRPAGALTVTPGTPTELKPGGYHVMLMDLKAPLVAGQSVTLSLTFEKAGTVNATASVEKAGSMGPSDMPGMKM
ncbi:MAG TPA: copper chaperone PCu(A)C [Stellaceae bacterium]|nr:copper chaperone PCu(A)C [Stellaceae bacterium]